MADRTEWTRLTTILMGSREMVTASDAAAYLGMKYQSFVNHVNAVGAMPDAKLGRVNLYTQTTLDALDRGRRPPGRPATTA